MVGVSCQSPQLRYRPGSPRSANLMHVDIKITAETVRLLRFWPDQCFSQGKKEVHLYKKQVVTRRKALVWFVGLVRLGYNGWRRHMWPDLPKGVLYTRSFKTHFSSPSVSCINAPTGYAFTTAESWTVCFHPGLFLKPVWRPRVLG